MKKMPERFLGKKAIGKILLSLMLALSFMMSTSLTVFAADNTLLEIRALLRTNYVNPVSSEVLNAPSVEETLSRLGDPNTNYFTSEEYQRFLEDLDLRFEGIGIHIEMVAGGVRVISVIPGSPGEDAGLRSGDLIIKASGQSLAGLSSEEAIGILRGPEGSTLKIRVTQGEEARDLTLVRRAIISPTVTGEVLGGHIGYLDLNSFGSDTAKDFEIVLNRLRSQNVDSWIVDLRDNGGGYVSSAIKLAGYFVGSEVSMRVKDRTGSFTDYQVEHSDFILNQPVIFLTNGYSASASELLSAAVKDYQKATLVGTNTYGKGTVQSMFPLKSGGVLKMTINRFYSPLGHEIDKVGVSPNVVIQNADELKAAELMLTNSTAALNRGRTNAYWEAWGELSGSSNYVHYYPSYRQVGELFKVPLDKKFTVNFSGEVNWQSINDSSIELINSKTGERTLTSLEPLGSSELRVIPKDSLTPDTVYWLVIHPTIQGVSGQVLKEGGLAIVHSIQGSEVVGTVPIQSYDLAM